MIRSLCARCAKTDISGQRRPLVSARGRLHQAGVNRARYRNRMPAGAR